MTAFQSLLSKSLFKRFVPMCTPIHRWWWAFLDRKLSLIHAGGSRSKAIWLSRGIMTVSGTFLTVTTGLMLLASSGWEDRRLRDTLQCTQSSTPHQSIIWPQISVVPKLTIADLSKQIWSLFLNTRSLLNEKPCLDRKTLAADLDVQVHGKSCFPNLTGGQ